MFNFIQFLEIHIHKRESLFYLIKNGPIKIATRSSDPLNQELVFQLQRFLTQYGAHSPLFTRGRCLYRLVVNIG
jgi:hypothetical protein